MYSRRHGKVPVPFALHDRATLLCVSVPFAFRSVQITLTVCTCSYTVEYRSVLSPFRKLKSDKEVETSSDRCVERYSMV